MIKRSKEASAVCGREIYALGVSGSFSGGVTTVPGSADADGDEFASSVDDRFTDSSGSGSSLGAGGDLSVEMSEV